MTEEQRQNTLHRRLLDNITFSAIESCWIWGKSKNNMGYGVMGSSRMKPRTFLAHRVAYQMFVGDIPKGLVLDHKCKTPLCVNPTHLDPVTQKENMHRGNGPCAINKRKAHCPCGDEYNHITPQGKRCCTKCRLKYNQKWRAKKKEG